MQEGGCTEIRTGHDEGGDLRARRRRSTNGDQHFLGSLSEPKKLLTGIYIIASDIHILHFFTPLGKPLQTEFLDHMERIGQNLALKFSH